LTVYLELRVSLGERTCKVRRGSHLNNSTTRPMVQKRMARWKSAFRACAGTRPTP